MRSVLGPGQARKAYHLEMPMRIQVRVVPNARKGLVKEEAGRLKVYVVVPAEGGRANAAVIEALARFYGVGTSRVRIVRGETSREKTIEIDA